MPDNAVTTDKWPLLCRIVVALLLGVILVMIVYTTTRMRTIYVLSLKVATLETALAALDKEHDILMDQSATRIDDIERVLFGDVVRQLQKTSPIPGLNRVELWQKNRDKELRDQIVTLQRWRQHVDEVLRELRERK